MKLMMSVACFYLLLVVLFMFRTSFSDDAAKFQGFGIGTGTGTGHASKFSPYYHAKGGSREDSSGEDNGSDSVLGDEKRKIFTGPNPLHNR